jgi:hypothetical protein
MTGSKQRGARRFDWFESPKSSVWWSNQPSTVYSRFRRTTSPSIKPFVIQPHLVRDLVGLDEDRLGFGSGWVSGVLEVHLYRCQVGLELVARRDR